MRAVIGKPEEAQMKRLNESRVDNTLLRLTLALVALVLVGSVGGEMIGAAFSNEPGPVLTWQAFAQPTVVG